jgi:hypothetical protein
MLKAHMAAVEATLLATSTIPANSGHSLHKGTPREAFIRQFLQDHLSERVAIGTGEIIDHNSSPNPPAQQQRPQFDIVLYDRSYPKLSFGGGVSAFLAESVVATIEVKSTVDAADVEQSMLAARYAKNLTRNLVTSFTTGYCPPGIINYVVAYSGPAQMKTVAGWLPGLHAKHSIPIPTLPGTGDARLNCASPSLDAIFVLGRGFVLFDNAPIGFVKDHLR